MPEYLKGNQDKFGGKNVPWKNRYNLYLSRWVGTSTYYLGATPLRYIFKFTLLLKATINISGSETGVVFLHVFYQLHLFGRRFPSQNTPDTNRPRLPFPIFVFLIFWEDYFHKKAATWEIGAFGAKQVTCQTILSFEKDIGGNATIIWTNVSFQMNYFVKCEDVQCTSLYTVDENLPFDLLVEFWSLLFTLSSLNWKEKRWC